MKYIFLLLFICLSTATYSQQLKRFPLIWTFHQKNAHIYGVSAGLWDFREDSSYTATSGIRISLLGEGLLVALMPASPLVENDEQLQQILKGRMNEQVNGISISGTGNAGAYRINGAAFGLVGHYHAIVNGISASAALNIAQVHRGIQIAPWINWAYRMRGMQIGVYNKSFDTRGIQLGIWNKNERRQLPLINWNFRKKTA